jgi:hypothetical protein
MSAGLLIIRDGWLHGLALTLLPREVVFVFFPADSGYFFELGNYLELWYLLVFHSFATLFALRQA